MGGVGDFHYALEQPLSFSGAAGFQAIYDARDKPEYP